MTIKTVGSEWNRFFSDTSVWPDSAWFDDAFIFVGGVEIDGDYDLSMVPESAEMTITGGIIFDDGIPSGGVSMENVFREWRKKQKITIVVVEVPNELTQKVCVAISKAGGKVLIPKNI